MRGDTQWAKRLEAEDREDWELKCKLAQLRSDFSNVTR
jgi:hypothetical protein